ncbi:hypothetical protein QFZ75_006549 [Streptomyces sp. V3I8]|uniref:hypothetical protein n=1 Tax=Streptomyces sp. V3I8 TaxID=3042279 RepID=UPI002780A50D|nr:hypothetical protein [Streptomyces sp. V3I8]MDQ1040133.1 hypothetical protein [Streptomyces sp. V3I8]
MRPNADTSRRLRAIADRTGLQLEQILTQLAEQVRMDETGALTVGSSSRTDQKCGAG